MSLQIERISQFVSVLFVFSSHIIYNHWVFYEIVDAKLHRNSIIFQFLNKNCEMHSEKETTTRDIDAVKTVCVEKDWRAT